MTEILLEFLRMYGLKEVVGKEHNPDILAMFAEIGFGYVQDDETAWCSTALNYICKKLGYERSGSLAARSWLKIGTKILEPTLGDIVVFWRESPSSWKGHVGLFISQDIDNVYTLGGNQNNSVSILPYPRDRVLGYRRVGKLSNIH